MNRNFCDVCGEQMETAGHTITISPQRSHCFGVFFSDDLYYGDVCDECCKQIVGMLRKFQSFRRDGIPNKTDSGKS